MKKYKLLIISIIFGCCATMAMAATADYIRYGAKFSEMGAPGTPESGQLHVYANTDGALCYVNDGGSTVTLTSGSGDNTLDNAYDQGGAGSGKKIDADSGAVEIEVDNASNNGALLLDMDDSTNNPDVLTITNAGSGNDIVAPNFTLANGVMAATTGTFSGTLTAGTFSGAFSPTSLSCGGAISAEGDLTLDDGTGASPSLIMKDADNETCTFSKVNSGYLTATTLAADGVQVLTGNLKVGNGSPGTAAMDGEDFYCEGASEFDGAAEFDGAVNIDGAVDMDSSLDVAGTVALSENVTFTMAADEYFKLDGDSTPMTQTAGALDINIENGATAVKGISLNLEAENTYANFYGIHIDVDDDASGGEETVDCIYISNSAGTASTVNGIQLANTLDVGIDAVNAAGGQTIVVDATTAAQTGTSGSIADLAFRTATDTAHAINLDVESDLAGAGEIAHGVKIQMDDDAGNADNEIHGIHIDTDENGTGLQHAVYVGGTAGIDAALYAANGYVRVGTGATPDQTPGDDDVFIEGTVEIDGNLYPDGNIIGDGATEIVGTRHDTVVSSGGTVAVAATASGTVYFNDQAAEFDLPADPTGLEFTFCVDNASNLVIDPNGTDRIWGATNANGDSLTSSTVGDTITLIGTDASTWFVKSAYPASTDWADTN